MEGSLANLKSVVGGFFLSVQARLSRQFKEGNFVYDIDLTYALRIENTSEGDPSTYEATNAVTTEENPKENQQQLVNNNNILTYSSNVIF